MSGNNDWDVGQGSGTWSAQGPRAGNAVPVRFVAVPRSDKSVWKQNRSQRPWNFRLKRDHRYRLIHNSDLLPRSSSKTFFNPIENIENYGDDPDRTVLTIPMIA